jgi:dephospho-CoA kinase|tara:strand:+ start:774 stop:1439 length:666 start_codon:yes stop_codon:yes gene_type:complete
MISFNELQEGVYDPNILKAFFLAGGPGSGKSYVVRQTTGGLGLKIVNSDKAFEKYLKDANLSLKMPDEEKYDRDPVRAKAKKITQKQKSNYVEGRLGLIIDGTGKNYAKISDEATRLKQLGYDVHMVFVNTSLDTALERNKRRSRSVPESLVIKSWKEVQSNIGKFSQYFRKNFVVVDNNDTDEDVMTPVYKQIKSLALAKISNPLGKQWVANELSKKKRK